MRTFYQKFNFWAGIFMSLIKAKFTVLSGNQCWRKVTEVLEYWRSGRLEEWKHSNIYKFIPSFLLAFLPLFLLASNPPDTSKCREIYVLDQGFDFVPVLKCKFDLPGIDSYSLPMFADIDGDGETEIVATLQHSPDGFAILNPRNCEIEHLVDVNGDVDHKDGGTVLGDVDRNGYVDIYIEVNTKIQRWEFNPQSQQMERKWETRWGVATAERSHLDIWDINQDGIAELIPNKGYMVDALTGYVYPGKLPELDEQGKGLFAFTADALLGEAPGGQGNVELIYGTHIYRYDFNTENWLNIKSQSEVDWGLMANVSLADMDLDGDVDAVITNWDEIGQALIWDLQTDELLGGGVNDYPGSYGSRMNIANMDEDPYPEMAMTCVFKVFALDDIVTSGRFGKVIWLDETTDESGHTQITSFDFDGNGTYEIAYRDETRLRVFNGIGDGIPNGPYPSGPLVLLDSGDEQLCESFTGMEYPTIGDVDNDNQAEIVSTCLKSISVYESGSLPWGNAVSVWNTQAYNVTCVNPDGTIPAKPIENYKLHNTFLAQVNLNPVLDTLVIEIPDAYISFGEITNDCDQIIRANLTICNQGATFFPAQTPIAIYWEDPTKVNSRVVDTLHLPVQLEVGECTQLITSELQAPSKTGNIYAVVSDDGSFNMPFILDGPENGGSFPLLNLKECDYTNNMTGKNYEIAQSKEAVINPVICESETFEINGQTYTEAGIYQTNFRTIAGCDSILTIKLEVLPPIFTQQNATICKGELYTFNNQKLDSPGFYTANYSAANGCDSIVELQLNILPPQKEEIQASICEGENYLFGNTLIVEEGFYTDTLKSLNGCDSIVHLQLDVRSNPLTVLYAEICDGEQFRLNGETFKSTGTYRQSLKSASGCDSIVVLNLDVLQPSFSKVIVDICPGTSYEFYDQVFQKQGIYHIPLTNMSGCDSIVTIDLRVLNRAKYEVKHSICEGESVMIAGQARFKSGEFTENLIAHNGCDSIVVHSLIVEPIPEIWAEGGIICEGESIELQVHGSNAVIWSPSASLSCADCPNPIATPSQTTTYIVTSTACNNTHLEAEVTVDVVPTPDISIGEDLELFYGQETQLTAKLDNFNFGTIKWSSGNKVLCENCPEITVTPQNNSSYQVEVQNELGCIASDEIKIMVRANCLDKDFFIPNLFSPNGDGVNDFFYIEPGVDVDMKWFRIYDRWGELMYSSNNMNDRWDGKFRGEALNPGVYVYYMEVVCPNNEPFKKFGNVTLIR